jgi:hypothetical protein
MIADRLLVVQVDAASRDALDLAAEARRTRVHDLAAGDRRPTAGGYRSLQVGGVPGHPSVRRVRGQSVQPLFRKAAALTSSSKTTGMRDDRLRAGHVSGSIAVWSTNAKPLILKRLKSPTHSIYRTAGCWKSNCAAALLNG